MADAGFNGSTITFGTGAETPLRSVRYADSCAAVDISGCADAIKTYVGGIPDPEVTFEVVGGSTVVAGDTGTVTIAWNDGVSSKTGALGATWLVTSAETGGDIDGEITTSITCKPATIPT